MNSKFDAVRVARVRAGHKRSDMRNLFWAAAAASLTAVAAFAAGPVPARAQVPPPAPAMTPVPLMSPAPAITPMPMATPAGSMMSPSPSPSPSPIPTPSNPAENTLVTARVRDEFTAWQRGHIDRKHYSPNAGGTYIDALVAQELPDLAAVGPLVSLQYRTASLLLGDLVYRYDVTAANGVVSVLYSLDPAGKADGIVFTPVIFRAASVSP